MFEIIDVSSDKMYFHIAVYADLETAKSELEKRFANNCAITDYGIKENYEEIEILEYPIG